MVPSAGVGRPHASSVPLNHTAYGDGGFPRAHSTPHLITQTPCGQFTPWALRRKQIDLLSYPTSFLSITESLKLSAVGAEWKALKMWHLILPEVGPEGFSKSNECGYRRPGSRSKDEAKFARRLQCEGPAKPGLRPLAQRKGPDSQPGPRGGEGGYPSPGQSQGWGRRLAPPGPWASRLRYF